MGKIYLTNGIGRLSVIATDKRCPECGNHVDLLVWEAGRHAKEWWACQSPGNAVSQRYCRFANQLPLADVDIQSAGVG